MKSFFITTLLLTQSVFASGLPKTAQIVLQLDQPAATVQFPSLDFSKAILQPASGLVKFSETGDIKVGNVSYKMDPTATVVLKEEATGLSVENLKFLRYRLYSETLKIVVANIVVNTETGTVTVNKDAQGQVTEWY